MKNDQVDLNNWLQSEVEEDQILSNELNYGPIHKNTSTKDYLGCSEWN